MKKSFVLFMSLVVLVIGMGCYVGTAIAKECNQVTFTEQVVYGDKHAAEGVTVQMKNRYEWNMFWDSTYVIGEHPSISTDYEFSPWMISTGTFDSYSNLWFNNQLHEHFQDFGENRSEAKGLEVAYLELAERTEPGTENCMLVNLKDYLDYYAFDVEINIFEENNPKSIGESLGESDLHYLMDVNNSEDIVKRNQKRYEKLMAFREFFKIPVIDDEWYMLSLSKNENGEVIGWGASSHTSGFGAGEVEIPPSPETGDNFAFTTYVTAADGYCYFTFDPYTENGNAVDVSYIPGGYGIYRLPYDIEKEEYYPEQLEMVYALDASIVLHDICMDQSKENLLLFTFEDNKFCISVIDSASMGFINRFEIGYEDDLGINGYWIYENYIIIDNCEELMVIEQNEEGIYELVFTASQEGLRKVEEQYPATAGILQYDTAFDWNGESLVFGHHLYNEESYPYSAFYVGVMSTDGLQYFGTYESSLYVGNGINYADCQPDRDSISISW